MYKEVDLAILQESVKNLKEGNAIEHKEIKDTLVKIDCKLDNVIDSKADKVEVRELNNRIWAGIITALTGICLALVSFFLKK